MKTTIELLTQAREWLSVEDHWCPGMRWDHRGSNCALGALDRVSGHTGADWWLSEIDAPMRRLAEAALVLDAKLAEFPGKHSPSTFIALFNDHAGYRRVLEMYDLAIKLESEEMDQQAKELVESCADMVESTPTSARS